MTTEIIIGWLVVYCLLFGMLLAAGFAENTILAELYDESPLIYIIVATLASLMWPLVIIMAVSFIVFSNILQRKQKNKEGILMEET